MAVRRALPTVAVVGALALVAAVFWGYAERHLVISTGTTVLLAFGTVLAVGALVAAEVSERRAAGLVVPPGTRLPGMRWALPLALVGLCAAVAGAYASPPFVVMGAVLLVAAAVGAPRQLHTGTEGLDRGAVVAARRIRAFGKRHAVNGEASVDCAFVHVGRGLVRVVVVGRDGSFGDVLVHGRGRAEKAAELAWATVQDPTSRELSARIRTGPYEWRRMAGMQLGGGR